MRVRGGATRSCAELGAGSSRSPGGGACMRCSPMASGACPASPCLACQARLSSRSSRSARRRRATCRATPRTRRARGWAERSARRLAARQRDEVQARSPRAMRASCRLQLGLLPHPEHPTIALLAQSRPRHARPTPPQPHPRASPPIGPSLPRPASPHPSPPAPHPSAPGASRRAQASPPPRQPTVRPPPQRWQPRRPHTRSVLRAQSTQRCRARRNHRGSRTWFGRA